jgi:hypothetical protein
LDLFSVIILRPSAALTLISFDYYYRIGKIEVLVSYQNIRVYPSDKLNS